MKTIETELLLRIVTGMHDGRIRPEHLKAFERDPDVVLAARDQEKLLELIPRYLEGADFVLDPLTVWYIATEKMEGKKWNLFVVEGSKMRSDRGRGVCGLVIGPDGSVAYIFRPHNTSDSYVVHAGKRGKSYHDIEQLALSDCKPIYIASSDRDRKFLVYGNKEQYIHPRFYNIRNPSILRGLPLYLASDNSQQGSVLFHGNQVMLRYAVIKCLTVVEEKALYVFKADNGAMQVVYDSFGGKEYANVAPYEPPTVVGGKPLYCAATDKQKFIVHGEREILVPPKTVIRQLNLLPDGTPVYVTFEEADPDKMFVMHGDERGKKYDEIFSLTVSERGFTYGARQGRKLYRVTRQIES